MLAKPSLPLCKGPNSHWLLSRLALTYYEEFKYEKALEHAALPLELVPNCALACGLCRSLEMLGREREALRIYQHLVNRGAESIASGERGEGLPRARGLVADCLYRMAVVTNRWGAQKNHSIV